MCILYKSWIHPILEYGNILYSGAANADLQSCIERTYSSVFQPLFQCPYAAIMGLVCRLLDGEGHGNLPAYCPQLLDNQPHCRSHHLHP